MSVWSDPLLKTSLPSDCYPHNQALYTAVREQAPDLRRHVQRDGPAGTGGTEAAPPTAAAATGGGTQATGAAGRGEKGGGGQSNSHGYVWRQAAVLL